MIRVLVADDHGVIREGLRIILNAEEDMIVVGEAENGVRAVEMSRLVHPDVVVMDVVMPELNGIDAMRQILDENRLTRVVMLSALRTNPHVIESMSSGARGYVSKHCNSGEVVAAIRAAYSGRIHLSSDVTHLLLGKPDGDLRFRLTPRERQVVQLIVEGRSIKQIASQLGLSVKTVEFHRRRAMDKLGAENTAQLVRIALESRLDGPMFDRYGPDDDSSVEDE